MRAKAPGKIVISGAYVVLEGAPALVSAVNRFALANDEETATLVTPEVAAALELQPYVGCLPPAFDASQQRSDGRKLGLGSSAAILLASLAVLPPTDLTTKEGRDALFQHALVAHRVAQGGGSGIDVAASCYGGSLHFQLGSDASSCPKTRPVSLPKELSLQVFASDRAASTSDFLQRVNQAKQEHSSQHQALMRRLASAAETAVDACEHDDAVRFIEALTEQYEGLNQLGLLAQIPICTPEVRTLASLAKSHGGIVLPAGAGGGDIALWAGRGAAPPPVVDALAKTAHSLLAVELNAPGVQRCD